MKSGKWKIFFNPISLISIQNIYIHAWMLYNTRFVDDVVEICVRQGNITFFQDEKATKKNDEMSSGMRQNEISSLLLACCLLLCEMGRWDVSGKQRVEWSGVFMKSLDPLLFTNWDRMRRRNTLLSSTSMVNENKFHFAISRKRRRQVSLVLASVYLSHLPAYSFCFSLFADIYRIMLSDKKYGLSVNMMATRVMPSLIPQTVNPSLNLEQFMILLEVSLLVVCNGGKQQNNFSIGLLTHARSKQQRYSIYVMKY